MLQNFLIRVFLASYFFPQEFFRYGIQGQKFMKKKFWVQNSEKKILENNVLERNSELKILEKNL